MNPEIHEPITTTTANVREVARAEAQAETRRFLDIFKPKTDEAKSRTAIWVSIAVAILLSVFGAWKSGWKEPIVIPPLNPAAQSQSQPLVLVVNLPAGATVSAAPTAPK